MNKICTSIEQSKKLIELGIDASTADMWYQYIGDSFKDGITKPIYFLMVTRDDPTEKDITAWSLTALLDILPLVETYKQTDGHKVFYYVELYTKHMGKEVYLSTERHENLVDACFEMVIKLNEMKLL